MTVTRDQWSLTDVLLCSGMPNVFVERCDVTAVAEAGALRRGRVTMWRSHVDVSRRRNVLPGQRTSSASQNSRKFCVINFLPVRSQYPVPTHGGLHRLDRHRSGHRLCAYAVLGVFNAWRYRYCCCISSAIFNLQQCSMPSAYENLKKYIFHVLHVN